MVYSLLIITNLNVMNRDYFANSISFVFMIITSFIQTKCKLQNYCNCTIIDLIANWDLQIKDFEVFDWNDLVHFELV